ncbi:hypothetical protein, partial [Actinoplanes nipponensis]|uniref:hypothetical protein n=1 Tax=Actinoplanes nipponensis TaxID=135950 RepID=UPI0035E4F49D
WPGGQVARRAGGPAGRWPGGQVARRPVVQASGMVTARAAGTPAEAQRAAPCGDSSAGERP